MIKTVLAALLALVTGASAALAGDATIGPMKVEHAWARASAGPANGAAYLTITNTGATADRLIAASGDVSKTAQLHNHINEGGVMKMRPVAAIEVAPGQTVTLAPGGYHIMLMGLKAPLKQGDSFPLTLSFEKAGAGQVQVDVQAAGAMGMDHGAMDHMHMAPGEMDHMHMDHQ